VDLAQAAPTAGSYQGADLRGLFWSMQPAAGEARDIAPGQVQLTARVAGQVPVLQTLHLRAAAPTLQWRDASPFPGARLAVPAGSAALGKRPAVIALGGSEGGAAMVTAGAALLASHGFVVLALPYYSPPVFSAKGPLPPEVAGLPTAFADIPVDRLNAARDWLAQQPEVDASRIALHGVSKGAEIGAGGGVAPGLAQGGGGHRAQRRGLGRLGPGRGAGPAGFVFLGRPATALCALCGL
jgi:hypothetical protein